MTSTNDTHAEEQEAPRGRNGRPLSPAAWKGRRAGLPSPNKGRRFPTEILTPDEARALIKACSNRAPTGIRNRALLVVMYRAGLRVSEALALKPKDVDLDTGTVTVLHGKGDRRRTVALDPGALAVVARWAERRQTLGFTGHQALFCTLEGKPVHSAYVRQLLPRLAKKAGINKRVHPHGLRHTHAYELACVDKIPIPVIQASLGHSSLATTDRYLRHIAPVEVIEMMKGRDWTL